MALFIEEGIVNMEKKANRLLGEVSPYLKQHAYNPVDWYPWGEEALQRARDEDRPIFLSIGYSSCHWCHVMERESFEDPEVAKLINDDFIPIKVDREERPDIDAIYMAAAQVLYGRGGWPLTLVLAPDKRPFFAATYLPKRTGGGIVGLMELLPTIARSWRDRRSEMEGISGQVMDILREQQGMAVGGDLGVEVMIGAYQGLKGSFDGRYGGFGGAPKFPTPHRLSFLLRYWFHTGEEDALEMVDRTLIAMRQGGIFDQLGHGFHRYSTDQRWLVPHFEKMLYDQALLALAYVEAWQATGKDTHAWTARQVLDYVLERLTSPDGAFYSSEDADSEGGEGKYYLWTEEEIAAAIGDEKMSMARRLFGTTPDGNVHISKGNGQRGENVLHVEDLSGSSDPAYERMRGELLAVRDRRPRPARDEKIMTDWNGLMIAALARCGAALGESRYVEAAERAANHLITAMVSSDGALLHLRKEGDASIPGFLDDHAFLIWGLLELHQVDQQLGWLERSITLMQAMIDRFWDDAGGGFFQTGHGSPDVIHRRKEAYDGAVPSGNSVALQTLVWLNSITGRACYLEKADALVSAFSGAILRSPEQYAHFLNGLDQRMGPFFTVVISGTKGGRDTSSFLRALASAYVPSKIVLVVEPGEEGDGLRAIAPVALGHSQQDGKAMGWVCTRTECLPGTSDASTLVALMRPLR